MMKTEITFIAAFFLLMTQLMVTTARPRFSRRIVRMKGNTMEETPTVILTRPIPSKESHKDEESTSRVLAKLLSLDDVNTSDRKQKPDAFSAALAKSSYEPKFHPDDKTKKTKQGKIRVRRQRCYPPFWKCSLQPTGSSRKRVLPQRGNKNL